MTQFHSSLSQGSVPKAVFRNGDNLTRRDSEFGAALSCDTVAIDDPGSIHEGGGLGYSVLSNVRMRHNDILVLICFIRFLSNLLLP